jgi:hypothetical protein
MLIVNLQKSDQHFYSIRSLLEKIKGYYNVGVDYCGEEVCGNTILCNMYLPFENVFSDEIGYIIRDLSVVSGKLVGFILDSNLIPYTYYDKKINIIYKDYHFYKRCPIKLKTDLGFILFSILCSINYATEFIDKIFKEEIPQKIKFAYLQYYYICDFMDELNNANKTNFYINKSLKNRLLRNCFAHYGLGQLMKKSEIDDGDILKGLTQKVFNMDYFTCKNYYINI